MKTLSGRVVLAAIILSCGFAIRIGSEEKGGARFDSASRQKTFHPDGTPNAPKELSMGTVGSVSYLQRSSRK